MQFSVYDVFYSFFLEDGSKISRNMLVRIRWIKYVKNKIVYFAGYLYITVLINARKLEHTY